MRAVILDEVPASPYVAQMPTPTPGRGEILVKVAASSVNGFDIATSAGVLQGMMEHRFPLIPGKDFAGTVTALGPDTVGFAVGQEVFGVVNKPDLGAGSLAEYVTVSAGHGIAHVPEGLSMSDAGALGLAGTAAADSVAALPVESAQTVLVAGATGGVGAIAVQLLAARGIRVVATARPGIEERFVRGLSQGEIFMVDYTGDLEAQVLELVPEGVDAALHLAGDGEALASLVAEGGYLASTLGLGPDAAQGRAVTVVSVMADTTRATLETLAEAVASGRLRVPVTETVSLDQGPEAFGSFRAGALGKISVSVH